VPEAARTRHRRRKGGEPIYLLSLNGSALLGTAIGLATDWAPGCRSGRQGTAQSGLIGSKSGLWLQGRFFVRPVATLPLLPIRIAGSQSHPCARPSTHDHMLAVRAWPPAEIRSRTGPFDRRSCEAPNGPLFLWLAVSKMLHRSLGRQGYVHPLSAFAALTDRERSRQRVPSALRAPLTRRVFPGATSFQHQPTREESP
jgi:hypothetical protein